MEDRLIEELKVLRVQPGETLVLQTERILSREQCEYIVGQIGRAGIKAVVVDAGLKVAAVQS